MVSPIFVSSRQKQCLTFYVYICWIYYDLREYWFLANLKSCTLCIYSFIQAGCKYNRNSLFLNTILWILCTGNLKTCDIMLDLLYFNKHNMAAQTCAVWLTTFFVSYGFIFFLVQIVGCFYFVCCMLIVLLLKLAVDFCWFRQTTPEVYL